MTDQAVFRAIADPTRREIMGLLAQNDMTLTQIVDQFEMSRPAIAKHLATLEQGGLISVQRTGRERINRLHPETLHVVRSWVAYFDQFWDEKLSALKQSVENDL